MKGNEAMAEAAIRAGCRHFFGYPITPQTEVAAYMSKKMPKIGGTYLQAESEIAAINMVLGAASAGVRAMTSSSSPGISLKTEGISYIAGSDLPCLIVNVERGAPSNVQEVVDLVFLAYDLAEKYRMPSLLLSDGLLGQMMEPVSFPDPVEKTAEKPWAACGHQNKRPHNIINSLYLKADQLERTVVERFARYAQVEANEQRCQQYLCDDADYIIVAFGATSRVSQSAVDTLREQGIKAGLLRPVTLWPFPKDAIRAHIPHVKGFLSVEMSMGQMVDDVRLAVEGRAPVGFFGRTGGVIPKPSEVVEAVRKMAGGDR